MGRKPLVPEELTTGPFTITQAALAGLTRAHLRGATWMRVAPATYMWTGLRADPMHAIHAMSTRLPGSAAFSGFTAVWLHKVDAQPCIPVEATVRDGAGVSARSGCLVRRAVLDEEDVVLIQGLRVTSMARTLADVSARVTLTEAVVIADAALHAGRIRLDELDSWATSHAGRRGIRKLRKVIEHAEPAAESPMESRLRMLLVLAGLPRPEAQVSLYGGSDQFLGRLDLFYRESRLGIEYDGDVHRNTLTADNRRQNRLLSSGIRLLRFTAADVLGNPGAVLTQVRTMLGQPIRRSPANG